MRRDDTLECVFVFDLLALLGELELYDMFDDCLEHIFLSPKVIKLGQDLASDMMELHASYPRCQTFKKMRCLVEVNALHKQLVIDEPRMVGLKKLVLHYLDKTLSKEEQMSNWGWRPLTESQENYAICDALVLLRLYDDMMDRIKIASERSKPFLIDDVAKEVDAVAMWAKAVAKKEKKREKMLAKRARKQAAAAAAREESRKKRRHN
ncbi:unnamed protein product [Chrysoparadoxa australica]